MSKSVTVTRDKHSDALQGARLVPARAPFTNGSPHQHTTASPQPLEQAQNQAGVAAVGDARAPPTSPSSTPPPNAYS